MTRFIFRFLAFIFLVFMVAFAVMDAAKTVGTSHFTMQGFNEFLAGMLQTDTIGFVLMIQDNMPKVLSSIVISLSATPAWIVFGLCSLLFYFIGQSNRPKFHKIAY